LDVCYWIHEFAPGREQMEDAWRSGRPPDFTCHSRIQAALDEMSNVSVRQLAEIYHYSPSTVFYVLTFVLRLKFQHWKWIPHFLSNDDKRSECQWQNPWKFRWSKRNAETSSTSGQRTSRVLCGIISSLDLGHRSTRRCLREFDRR
jgi:hypothetical protein